MYVRISLLIILTRVYYCLNYVEQYLVLFSSRHQCYFVSSVISRVKSVEMVTTSKETLHLIFLIFSSTEAIV